MNGVGGDTEEKSGGEGTFLKCISSPELYLFVLIFQHIIYLYICVARD